MATNIDKSLYQAPMGLSDLAGPDIEIEIEDPEAVRIGIDGIEIEIEPGEDTAEDFEANIADYMSDSELDSLGRTLAKTLWIVRSGYRPTLTGLSC